jgi:hypothetical protein
MTPSTVPGPSSRRISDNAEPVRDLRTPRAELVASRSASAKSPMRATHGTTTMSHMLLAYAKAA